MFPESAPSGKEERSDDECYEREETGEEEQEEDDTSEHHDAYDAQIALHIDLSIVLITAALKKIQYILIG